MVQGARPLPSSPLPSPLASYVLTRTQTTIVPNPEISTLAEDKPAARTSACDPQPKPPHSDPRHDGLLMQYLYVPCLPRARHRCTRKYDVAAGVDRGELRFVPYLGIVSGGGRRAAATGARRGKRQEARGKRQEARGKRREARGERREARGTSKDVGRLREQNQHATVLTAVANTSADLVRLARYGRLF